MRSHASPLCAREITSVATARIEGLPCGEQKSWSASLYFCCFPSRSSSAALYEWHAETFQDPATDVSLLCFWYQGRKIGRIRIWAKRSCPVRIRHFGEMHGRLEGRTLGVGGNLRFMNPSLERRKKSSFCMQMFINVFFFFFSFKLLEEQYVMLYGISEKRWRKNKFDQIHSCQDFWIFQKTFWFW